MNLFSILALIMSFVVFSAKKTKAFSIKQLPAIVTKFIKLHSNTIWFKIILAILALLALYILFKIIRFFFLKLIKTDMAYSPKDIGRGDTVSITVRVRPGIGIGVKRIVVTLNSVRTFGRKVALGIKDYTGAELVWSKEVELSKRAKLKSGKSYPFTGEVVIPQDAMPTSEYGGFENFWYIEAFVILPFWGKMKMIEDVEVLDAVRKRPSARIMEAFKERKPLAEERTATIIDSKTLRDEPHKARITGSGKSHRTEDVSTAKRAEAKEPSPMPSSITPGKTSKRKQFSLFEMSEDEISSAAQEGEGKPSKILVSESELPPEPEPPKVKKKKKEEKKEESLVAKLSGIFMPGKKKEEEKKEEKPAAKKAGETAEPVVVDGTFPPGTVIGGRYEVISKLGEGGMGAVFKVNDKRTGQIAALKVLTASKELDQHAIRRFEREADSGMKMKHPNIISIADFGSDRGIHYFSMEYIEGVNIRSWAREHYLDFPKILGAIEDIASALAYAHDKEIVHRDIKPENIMITADSTVKVMDFGLALRMSDRTKLTQTGAVLGTVSYMAPEQAMGKKADNRTDIYALGVVAYEMLTGRLPFEGTEPVSLIFKHISDPPPPIRDVLSDIPESIAAIVHKMLEKEPENRHQNCYELIKELERIKGETTGSAAAPASGYEETMESSDLVGREKEEIEMKRFAKRAFEEGGRVLFIGGKAGVGKTRLAQEAQAIIERMGGQFVMYAYPRDQEEEFLAFKGMIKEYSRVVNKSISALVPEHSDELVDFIKGSTEKKLGYFETIEMLYKFFMKIFHAEKMALFFDNFERFDEASMECLLSVARAITRERILLIGAFRTEELEQKHRARDILEQLAAENLCDAMLLEPLPAASAKTIICRIAGCGEVDETLLENIFQESGGLPGRTEKIVSRLLSEGMLKVEGKKLIQA